MIATRTHTIQWVTAAPLWPTAAETPAVMQAPALLRFESDKFMDEFAELLASDPSTLANHLASPRSHRQRPIGTPDDWQPPPPDALKLYQPVHGHFHLVAATLVCRLPGMPDRALDANHGDKVGFVLRRLDDDGTEMAWAPPPDVNLLIGHVTLSGLIRNRMPAGSVVSRRLARRASEPRIVKVSAQKGANAWQRLTPDRYQMLADGEDLLPMFPVPYVEDGRRRRLLAGLIPTSSRETYQAAPKLPANVPAEDGRLEEFRVRVRAAIEGLFATMPPWPGPIAAPATPADQQLREQQQETSMFLLLDFADFLKKYNIDVVDDPATYASAKLFQTLDQTPATDGATWRQALHDAWAQRQIINGEQAGTLSPAYTLVNNHLYELLTPDPNADPAINGGRTLQGLEDAVKAILPPLNQPTTSGNVTVPKLDATGGAFYVLRCVYRRTTCRPPHADVLSGATQPFQLAPYFDPDAPSRPIRIPMPVDTSIAGLRKFAKNVAFMTSDKLRGQVASVSGLKDMLDGKLASGGGFGLGEICSFSLPVITLCAMIVLIIFVILLNIAFWWMPFFRICLPIPLPSKKG